VQSPEAVQRFQREIQALAKLSHANIVAVHDAGMADGTHYFVMDLVVGKDLARVVRDDGPLPPERAVDYVLQAARGLEYAHAAGIVHRDIKPSNLILDSQRKVRILDLGIARVEATDDAPADLTRTGSILGTVDYMPPEQALNTRKADQRADVYSLGCTLYFLLTGQAVYGGETVMERASCAVAFASLPCRAGLVGARLSANDCQASGGSHADDDRGDRRFAEQGRASPGPSPAHRDLDRPAADRPRDRRRFDQAALASFAGSPHVADGRRLSSNCRRLEAVGRHRAEHYSARQAVLGRMHVWPARPHRPLASRRHDLPRRKDHGPACPH